MFMYGGVERRIFKQWKSKWKDLELGGVPEPSKTSKRLAQSLSDEGR